MSIPVIPLIHYSVQRWRGTHPTVITSSGGGLDARMGIALGMSFLLFTLIASLLVAARYRVERERERTVELLHRALERGLGENP